MYKAKISNNLSFMIYGIGKATSLRLQKCMYPITKEFSEYIGLLSFYFLTFLCILDGSARNHTLPEASTSTKEEILSLPEGGE